MVTEGGRSKEEAEGRTLVEIRGLWCMQIKGEKGGMRERDGRQYTRKRGYICIKKPEYGTVQNG